MSGKHFSYTLDISGVGCHCNAAAYFVVAQNNPFPGKDGSHYCDAKGGNQVLYVLMKHFCTCPKEFHIVAVQSMIVGKAINTPWMSTLGLVGLKMTMELGPTVSRSLVATKMSTMPIKL